MKLYELEAKYRDALDTIEGAEELTDEQWQMLEQIEGDLDEKIESVAMFIRGMEADQNAVEFERKRLQAKERAIGNRVDWLKGYLLDTMTATGHDKVKGVLNVSLRACPPSCKVMDEDAVPEAFRVTETVVKINRKAILDAFKTTGDVPDGVEIVTDKKSVNIR